MSYWFVVGLSFTFYTAILPFRTFAIDFLTNKILAAHGGITAWKRCGCGRTSARECSIVCCLFRHGGHAAYRIAVRQNWKARVLDDVCLHSADARLSADGIYQRFSFHSSVHDGNRLFRDSSSNVSFGGVHRGSEAMGHCLCTDDTD